MASHFESAKCNALYMSKHTKPEQIIEVSGDLIQVALLKEIRSSFDEAVDSINREEPSISISYVNDYRIEERFMGLVSVFTGMNGEAIFYNISQMSNFLLAYCMVRLMMVQETRLVGRMVLLHHSFLS